MKSVQSAKTLLSTLVVLSRGSDAFRRSMQELMQNKVETYSKHQKSEHRADIELTFQDVVQRAKVSYELIKKKPTNRNLVDNLILNLMTGVNEDVAYVGK
jgi:hypothetical protein